MENSVITQDKQKATKLIKEYIVDYFLSNQDKGYFFNSINPAKDNRNSTIATMMVDLFKVGLDWYFQPGNVIQSSEGSNHTEAIDNVFTFEELLNLQEQNVVDNNLKDIKEKIVRSIVSVRNESPEQLAQLKQICDDKNSFLAQMIDSQRAWSGWLASFAGKVTETRQEIEEIFSNLEHDLVPLIEETFDEWVGGQANDELYDESAAILSSIGFFSETQRLNDTVVKGDDLSLVL